MILSKKIVFAALFLVVAGFTFVGFSLAADKKDARDVQEKKTFVLDGKKFRSRQYNKDGSPRDWDVLSFKDGKFISENCMPYGFSEAPYWIRFEQNAVHFFAEIVSPTHGVMIWKGVVKGNKIEGNVDWTRERWYWTIRNDWDFNGTLNE